MARLRLSSSAANLIASSPRLEQGRLPSQQTLQAGPYELTQDLSHRCHSLPLSRRRRNPRLSCRPSAPSPLPPPLPACRPSSVPARPSPQTTPVRRPHRSSRRSSSSSVRLLPSPPRCSPADLDAMRTHSARKRTGAHQRALRPQGAVTLRELADPLPPFASRRVEDEREVVRPSAPHFGQSTPADTSRDAASTPASPSPRRP